MKARIKDVYTKCAREGSINLSKAQICSGRELANKFGYPMKKLGEVPDSHWRTFAGCGNPWKRIPVRSGWTILDLGCGTGIDTLLASKFIEDEGLVIGVDFVFDMVRSGHKLLKKLRTPGQVNAFFLTGDGEFLPFREQVFDLVVCNGVFSLFRDKKRAVEEIYRVLKKEGIFVSCDLVRLCPLPAYFYEEADSWAWCMAGAPSKVELERLLDGVGFSVSEFSWGQVLCYFARATVVGVKKLSPTAKDGRN